MGNGFYSDRKIPNDFPVSSKFRINFMLLVSESVRELRKLM